MSENFYVVIATVLPVLLLSSTFATFAPGVKWARKWEMWLVKVTIWAIALLCGLAAIGFSAVTAALANGQTLPDWANELIFVDAIALFAANVGILIGRLVESTSEMKPDSDEGGGSRSE